MTTHEAAQLEIDGSSVAAALISEIETHGSLEELLTAALRATCLRLRSRR